MILGLGDGSVGKSEGCDSQEWGGWSSNISDPCEKLDIISHLLSHHSSWGNGAQGKVVMKEYLPINKMEGDKQHQNIVF